MIEFKVIGEDTATIAVDLGYLAECFGVRLGEVSFERPSEYTVIGTAFGQVAPKESAA